MVCYIEYNAIAMMKQKTSQLAASVVNSRLGPGEDSKVSPEQGEVTPIVVVLGQYTAMEWDRR
jgi:hypothetical protein